MLTVTIGLMVGAWFKANQLQHAEHAIQDESGTATVSAEPEMFEIESLAPDSNTTAEAVELSRISDFQDHSRELDPDPYYYLLDLARRNPAAWMESHARRDVTWAHLFREPEKYRGQLIYLKGRLRRLVVDDCDPNEYGIAKRYEGWMFTDESGHHGYAVIVAEPPVGMPVGAIYEYASVAGYFLGWWRHQNQLDKPTSSPILFAQRFNWIHPPTVRPDASLAVTYGLPIGIAIAVLGVAVAVVTLRRKPPPHDTVAASSEPLEFEEMPTPRICDSPNSNPTSRTDHSREN
jgi:hypothetical protein